MEMYIIIEGRGSSPLSTKNLVEMLKYGKARINWMKNLKVRKVKDAIIELEVVRSLGAERIDKVGGNIIEFFDRMERRKGVYLVKWSKAKTLFNGTGLEKTEIPLKPLSEEREEWKENVEELTFDEMLMKYW